MKNDYDLLVVGAGPAGTVAAYQAAKRGLEVLVIDKRQEIGSPVRCAEGVSKRALSKFLEPNPDWIAQEIQGFRLYAPDGSYLTFGTQRKGYILERKIFDRELANIATKAGATVLTKTCATGLVFEQGKVAGAYFSRYGQKHPIKSRVLIAADGIESQVGRWAGLDTLLQLEDVYSAAQYLMANIDIDDNICEFHFGRDITPGGYAWVFPKGERMANVGMGIMGALAQSKSALQYLDEFVERRFPRGSMLGVMFGGIPAGKPIEKMVTDGLMVVGDAAHQTDPLTGAGIINAMWAGKIAGEVAAQAMAANDFSAHTLQEYERRWRETAGRTLEASHCLRQVVWSDISDEDLNETVRVLSDRDPDHLRLKDVLITVFKRQPGLLVKVIRWLERDKFF